MAKFVKHFIVIRHGYHKDNFLIPSAINLCLSIGKKLRRFLIRRHIDLPKTAITSPQWRSISTMYFVLQGMKHSVALENLESALGDIRTGKYPFTKSEIKEIYAMDKKMGTNDADRYIISKFPAKMQKRGAEGAAALRKLLLQKDGPIILVSHGGSRLEAMFQVLNQQPISDFPYYFERNGVALFTYKVSGKKITFLRNEYLGFLN